jgi:hypothetical protein
MTEKNKHYRRLNVPVKKPRPLDARFWWMAGILLCVLFIACTVMAYNAHRSR